MGLGHSLTWSTDSVALSFFEGMNLVIRDIKKVLERVASIQAKMPLTRLLSHVSVMAIF